MILPKVKSYSKKFFYNSKNRKKIQNLLLKNLYTCSFSFNGNMLSQWRAYGDIAIGFDYFSIKNNQRFLRDYSGDSFFLDTSGTQFGICEYIDISKDDNVLTNKISEINKYEKLFESSEQLDKQSALLRIGSMCFCVKHCGFYEENEARIYSYLWNKKPKKNKRTKYIEYKIDPKVLKEIIIGPSKNKTNSFLKNTVISSY